MDFKQLESFAAVVKCNSFTKAAEMLYISQPTISTHIRALEAELNCALIHRTTKSVVLTVEGKKLYEYASNILNLRDRMIQECAVGSRRIVHVAASTIPSAYILPKVLPEFGNLYPSTYFVLHQNDSRSVIDGVLDGVFDVGLTGMMHEAENLISKKFCNDQMVLITPVSQHFLDLQQENVSVPEILMKESVILREKGDGSKKRVDHYMERIGLSEDRLNITARVNDPEAIKNLVASGMGVSIISKRAAGNFLREKRLLAFELPDDSFKRQLYVVCRKDRAEDPYIKNFLDFMTRYFEVKEKN